MSLSSGVGDEPGIIDIVSVNEEIALLGALIINPQKIVPMVEDILLPSYFSSSVYGDIYAEILRLYVDGHLPDPFSIRRFLDKHPSSGQIKPSEFVAKIVSAMVGLNEINREYALTIRDSWRRRTLYLACKETTELCLMPGTESAQEISDQLEARLLDLADPALDTEKNVPVFQAIAKAYEDAQEAVRRGDALAGISSGYRSFDVLTNGLVGGNLYLIGARPGMGKTSIALGMGMRIACSGKRVLFWSGEMTAKQLGARAASGKTGLNLRSILSGRDWDDGEGRRSLSKAQWSHFMAACDEATKFPIEFDTRGAISVVQLRSRARRMKRSKTGLDAIILDYVGLMSASSHATRGGLYAALTEISKDLKSLAKELDVPVIALAQLNRKVEERPDKKPMMSDLRDSGGLEQDADVIGLLYRAEYYLRKELQEGRRKDETDEKWKVRADELLLRIGDCEGQGQLHIAKNRHGPEGLVRLRFEAATTWFRDETERASSNAWGEKL
ncbi:DNA helicase [Acetobacteraceae bacterium EV16G]|uniref:DNA 5'-3' helicase n=1 Tax=Sorlinia euscelidii TaxID=3081148 RepID=A0ABU7U4L0_9PROT